MIIQNTRQWVSSLSSTVLFEFFVHLHLTPRLYDFPCNCTYFHLHYKMRDSNNSPLLNHTNTPELILASFNGEEIQPIQIFPSQPMWKLFKNSFTLTACWSLVKLDAPLSDYLLTTITWGGKYVNTSSVPTHMKYSLSPLIDASSTSSTCIWGIPFASTVH